MKTDKKIGFCTHYTHAVQKPARTSLLDTGTVPAVTATSAMIHGRVMLLKLTTTTHNKLLIDYLIVAIWRL
jgi:hypothetical protein